MQPQNTSCLSTQGGYESDYNSAHEDILAARKIEEYLSIFEVFRLRDVKMLTLTIASAMTLSRSSGIWSDVQVEDILSYLSKPTRDKVIRNLKEYRWMERDGIDYKLSDKARAFILCMIPYLMQGEMSTADETRLIIGQAEHLEYLPSLSEEERAQALSRIMGGLRLQRDKLRRTMEKRSRREIQEVIRDHRKIMNNITEVDKKLLRRNERDLFGRLRDRHEAYQLLQETSRLVSDICLAFSQTLTEQAQSIGETITPEMVDDFLATATIDDLFNIARPNLHTPKLAFPVRETTLLAKTKTFLEGQPEDYVEDLPVPQAVEYQEEQVVVTKADAPRERFYHYVAAKMAGIEEAPIEQALFTPDDTFGEVVYKIVRMAGLDYDSQVDPKVAALRFRLKVGLEEKSIDRPAGVAITEMVVRKENSNDRTDDIV